MATDRYHRQTLLAQLGSAGQAKLAGASVLVVGCGALGSTIAEQLARAGVGRLRIADRDIVELTNLQRQVLFDESDADAGLPKAVAAANRLSRINSTITIEPRVVDVDADNIESLCENTQLMLDGTDNVATRYLINDAAIKRRTPWVYGACIGTEGRVMPVMPGRTACLRCVFPEAPDPRSLPTCDTAGVLGPVASWVACLQSVQAIKILTGAEIAPEMISADLWTNRIQTISLEDARREDCPACGLRRFDFLDSPARESTARLCGRNTVQVSPARGAPPMSLPDVANRLSSAGKVTLTPFMVRCAMAEGDLTLTVFQDGRALVQGIDNPPRARSIVARYLGA